MRLSIVVAPTTSTESARRLLGSVDRLSTPYDDFELVFLCTDERDLPESLRSVLPYRPNVRALAVDDPADATTWRERLVGDFTLGVSDVETLFPRSVGELLDFAIDNQLEAVTGRVVSPGGGMPAELLENTTELAPAVGNGLLWMVSTDRVARLDKGHLVPPPDVRCGGLGSYPLVVRHVQETGDRSLSLETDLSWVGRQLVLTTIVDRPVTSAWLALQHLTTFEVHLASAKIDAGAFPATRISADIDPMTAGAGESLALGLWTIRLEVADSHDVTTVVDVAPAHAAPALLGSSGVVVHTADRLTLDIGAARSPLLPSLDAGLASIEESAGGNLLSLPLPGLHCFEAKDLSCTVFLGKLAVPGRVEIVGDQARLRAFVSGIAGDQPMAAKFGRGVKQDLGLTLHVDGLGAMSVVPTPSPPKRKKRSKPKATATKRHRRRPRPKGPVAALRRAVPKPLEPFARRLSGVPVFRRIYRRLTTP